MPRPVYTQAAINALDDVQLHEALRAANRRADYVGRFAIVGSVGLVFALFICVSSPAEWGIALIGFSAGTAFAWRMAWNAKERYCTIQARLIDAAGHRLHERLRRTNPPEQEGARVDITPLSTNLKDLEAQLAKMPPHLADLMRHHQGAVWVTARGPLFMVGVALMRDGKAAAVLSPKDPRDDGVSLCSLVTIEMSRLRELRRAGRG